MKHVVIGGTGTLGKTLIGELIRDSRNEVVCFSRCELKQKETKEEFKNPSNLRFVLGDIRIPETLSRVMDGAEVVYHVAALKHVDIIEENPEESVRTNIQGTINVADAAIRSGVPYCLFSSTDKAVDPINVYGMCKGISERLLLRRNETQIGTKFTIYRWGNVLGSRGSVIHSFANSLLKYNRVFLTDPEMTRFWIRIEDAVDFMLSTFVNAPSEKVLIPDIKSAPVIDVISTIAKILEIDGYEVTVSGMRRGEKLHEVLMSQHQVALCSSDEAYRYSEDELEKLIRPILKPYLKDRPEKYLCLS